MEVFRISFKVEDIYAGLLAQFIEKLSIKNKMGDMETLRLTLAVEELVAYLSSTIEGEQVQLVMSSLPLGIKLDLAFEVNPEGFRYFNFVVDNSKFLEGDEHMAHLGLLLAAKAVDRYSMDLDNKQLSISLIKERSFDTIEAKEYIPSGKPVSHSHKLEKNLGILEEACAYVMGSYDTSSYESIITKPHKINALVASGDYDYTLAYDEIGKVNGFMYWNKSEESCYEFFGPYTFGDSKKEVAELLSTQMVEQTAKSNSYFLISEKVTTDIPELLFEQADLSHGSYQKVFYRQLKEDMGTAVWCPSQLREFLDDFYDQLLLFREVMDASSLNEEAQAYSVFSVEPDQVQSQATIVPYIFGADAESNIESHIEVLKREGFNQIRVKFDLHYKWQGYLAGLFFDKGFKPVYIKPQGGKSDVLIMQYHED